MSELRKSCWELTSCYLSKDRWERTRICGCRLGFMIWNLSHLQTTMFLRHFHAVIVGYIVISLVGWWLEGQPHVSKKISEGWLMVCLSPALRACVLVIPPMEFLLRTTDPLMCEIRSLYVAPIRSFESNSCFLWGDESPFEELVTSLKVDSWLVVNV